jgi:flagellar biosynthesis/type III secretory pathway M-ring protein FliF/YscJ
MDILSFILATTTLVASGGWFIHYRLHRKKLEKEVEQQEISNTSLDIQNTQEGLTLYQNLKKLLDSQITSLGSHEQSHKLIEMKLDKFSEDMLKFRKEFNAYRKNNPLKELTKLVKENTENLSQIIKYLNGEFDNWRQYDKPKP